MINQQELERTVRQKPNEKRKIIQGVELKRRWLNTSVLERPSTKIESA